MFFLKQQLRVFALTKRSSRVSNWLVGVVMCFLYLTKPTVVFSSTFSRAFSPTFYPTLIADEVAAFIYLLPIIKLGFQNSNLLLAEPSVEQQTKQVINPQLPPLIKPRKYSPPLSFSDHTGLQLAGAGHFYQRIHVYPATGSGSSPFTTPEPDDCTATEASENTQYQLEGEQRTFSSFGALLTIPELWSRFTDYLPVYDSHTELPNDEADAKCVVLNVPKLRGIFLLINNVQQIPLTAARSRAESPGSPTAAASSEVVERQAGAATTSRVRNIAMESESPRAGSVMSLSGKKYRYECCPRRKLTNAIDLYTEGFYYSYVHQQLECFSCGGVFDPEKVSHCSSLRELHGKFYPNCRFLLQQAGEEYVSCCQQNLTDEERAIAPQPLPNDSGLYSEPISSDDIARELAGIQSDIDQMNLQEGRVPGISLKEYSKARSEALQRADAEQCERHGHCSSRQPGADCAAPAHFRNDTSNDTPARAGSASVSSNSDIRPLHRGPEEAAFQNIPLYDHSLVAENPPQRANRRFQAPCSNRFRLHALGRRIENIMDHHEHDTGRSSGQRPWADSAALAPSDSTFLRLHGRPALRNILAHIRNIHTPIDSDIQHFQGVLYPRSFQALRTLRERIEDFRHCHERDRLRQNFLEITNNLDSLPPELCRLVGAEITAMIAAINQGDCQDHTSEVLDQIHTRVTFAVFRHELQTSQTAEQPVEIFDVFDRLKLFFNESVLYKLLGEFEENGKPLVQRRESTEIRSYLKNRFSGICRFPGRNILQAHSSIPWLSDELMDRVRQTLIKRISDPAGFVRYLTGLFNTDTVFLDYIKQCDEHFAKQYNDIVTTAYSDLEQYTSGNSEFSEQEVLEGAARVKADRIASIVQLVQGYAETQVKLFWNRILENEYLQNQRDHE